MLTVRPSRERRPGLLNGDLRWELFDGEEAIGRVTYDKSAWRAEMSIDDAAFTVEKTNDTRPEVLYQFAIRKAKGGEKKPPIAFALKDANGVVNASAERSGKGFAVHRGEASFGFHKGRSRPFVLTRDGEATPLGWVGQERFWQKTMSMDLPPEFDAPFQVFLLMLLMGLAMERAETASD